MFGKLQELVWSVRLISTSLGSSFRNVNAETASYFNLC